MFLIIIIRGIDRIRKRFRLVRKSKVKEAAWKCVAPELEPGMGTVGTLMNVQHTSATPLSMHVTAECELTEVDNRRLVFTVKAFDEVGPIGSGTHERFIVKDEKFVAKANAKRG